jgi:hypothetical protein
MIGVFSFLRLAGGLLFRVGMNIISAYEVGEAAYGYIIDPVYNWITNNAESGVIASSSSELDQQLYSHYKPIPLVQGNQQYMDDVRSQADVVFGKTSGVIDERFDKVFDFMSSRFVSGMHNWSVEISLAIKSLILFRLIVRREVVITPEMIEALTQMAMADAEYNQYLYPPAKDGERGSYGYTDVDEIAEALSASVYRAFEKARTDDRYSYMFQHLPDSAEDQSGRDLQIASGIASVMRGDIPANDRDLPRLMFDR